MQEIGWRSIGVLAFVVAGCAGEPLSEEDLGEVQQQAVAARACIGIGTLPPAPPITASVVTLQAGATDATISAAEPTTRLGNQKLCIAASGAQERSCLLRFDLASVPPNALIHSAELTFTAKDLGAKRYRIHKVLERWSEFGVTWNRYNSQSLWSIPGAKGSSDRGDSICEFTGETGRQSYALNTASVATIQAWVDGETNSGLAIETTDPSALLALQSSEFGVDVPQLKVWYSPASTPSSVELVASAATTIKAASPISNFHQQATCVAKRVGGLEEACLLRWDLSSIPTNGQVTAVSLTYSQAIDTARYDLFAVRQPWTELGATWNSYAAGLPWSAPGANSGDDLESVFANLVNQSPNAKLPVALMHTSAVRTVQGWVSNPSSNKGLLAAPVRFGSVPMPALLMDSRPPRVMGDSPPLVLTVVYRLLT